METLEFFRVPSDLNGNPRYAVKFRALLTQSECDSTHWNWKYAEACKRANTIGGRKYDTKHFVECIVFQSYSIQATADAIGRVTGREFKAIKG